MYDHSVQTVCFVLTIGTLVGGSARAQPIDSADSSLVPVQFRVSRLASQSPDEYAELRLEDLTLEAVHNTLGAFVTRPVIDKVYQILRSTAFVTITVSNQWQGGMQLVSVATITAVPNPTPLGNDTLVTIPSGLGVGSFSTMTTNALTLSGAQGRNHSSVANAGVASSVWPWLRTIERQSGDLR